VLALVVQRLLQLFRRDAALLEEQLSDSYRHRKKPGVISPEETGKSHPVSSVRNREIKPGFF
jgi:hypothetical protein